jgi:selenocysteine lyase/cysteine desulfurase
MKGVHHNILTEILSREAAIAVRSGQFCAHPYAQKLLHLSPEELEYYRDNEHAPLPGMVRVSFGLYNNIREIDVLLSMLYRISQNKHLFNNKYKNAILSAHP